jgi:hypothetical protein
VVNSGTIDPFAACGATSASAAAPMLRLRNREYMNALADLFPGVTIPTPALPDDAVDEGFEGLASSQSAAPALVEGYFDQARAVASAVVGKLSTVLPCSAASSVDEASCGKTFIADLTRRAYRRPATDDELKRVTTLFDTARSSWGFSKAIELVITGVLQAPQFLYRPELGATAQTGSAISLTGYEIASRISFMLTESIPDDQLLDAAASGKLDDADGIEAEVRRLLDGPRAHAAIADFQRQWLRFDKLDTLQKSATLFPSFDASTASALKDSTAQYVDYLFWTRGTLDAYFNDTKAFVNDDLAPIYGVSGSVGSKLKLVDVDSTRRAGLLTNAGLLAGFAHETTDSPVLRGVFVMDRLLCQAPPPPPPGVPPLAEPKAGDPAVTTRDRLVQTHEQPQCAGCHQRIDGIGFAFEHYDAIGAYRDTESGLPVDATGTLTGTDVDGAYDGAVELAHKLEKSDVVRACVAQQVYRYSLGLTKQQVDLCSLKQSVQQAAASGFDLRELIVAIMTDPSFRTKPANSP